MTDEGRSGARTEMTDPLAERLVATLDRRAATVGDGPRFAAADIVRAGHRAVRRRRIAAGAAVVVTVAAILAGSMIARRPVPPPSAPASTTDTAPPRTVVRPEFDVLSGNTIYRTDGSSVTLRLPGDRSLDDAARTPWGWVVDARMPDSPSEVWLVPDSGEPRLLGRWDGGYMFSTDGRVLVTSEKDAIKAYDFPSLREIGRHSFTEGTELDLIGVAKDLVLLNVRSDGMPSRAALWSLRTGSFTVTARDVVAYSMSDDGHVLRSVGDCLDVVPVTDRIPVGHTGWCEGKHEEDRFQEGDISPDGRWVAINLGPDTPYTMLIRTSDLRAGRWRLVPTGGPDYARLGWLTADTFVLTDENDVIVVCRLADHCSALPGPPVPSLVGG